MDFRTFIIRRLNRAAKQVVAFSADALTVFELRYFSGSDAKSSAIGRRSASQTRSFLLPCMVFSPTVKAAADKSLTSALRPDRKSETRHGY